MTHPETSPAWLDALNQPHGAKEQFYNDLDQRHKEIRARGIDIIVPVYKGLEQTERCIRSVLSATTFPFRLWLINDHSPETGMAQMLASFENDSRVHILTNEQNLGFTGTVNRGFRETEGDVVILNSDTEVYAGWLDNMVRAAVWNPTAATVTPYSSNAGIFTLPVETEGVQYSPAQIADALNVLGDGSCMKVVVGHGFCMLIRREALEKAGLFDEEAFGKGYGEETDFCLRCSRLGYVHILDTSTYVYHDEGVSFGAERQTRIQNSRRIIDERYPEYAGQLEVWKRDELWKNKKTMLSSRIQTYLQLNQARKIHPRKRLLSVMHRGKGGSLLTKLDLMRALSDGYDCYLLTSDWRSMWLEVITPGSPITIRIFKTDIPLSYNQLEREDAMNIYAEILRKYRIDAVNMGHMLGHTFDLVKECRRLDIPCIYVHHDYYMVCPNYTLTDDDGLYCGGTCCADDGRKCLTSSGWLAHHPRLTQDHVALWRSVMAEYLPLFTRHITPSEYCRQIIVQTHPHLEQSTVAIEHGRDFPQDWDCGSRYPEPGERIRVLIPGNIGKSKGMAFLARLAARNADKRLEIHILGDVHKDLHSLDFVLHGEYDRETLPQLVKEIRPHYALIPSVFPETYCHTLTEAWMLRLPTIVFDIGVLQARMRQSDAGWILPVSDENAVYTLLTEQITPEEYAEKKKNVFRYSPRSTRDMALDYHRILESPQPMLSGEALDAQLLRTRVLALASPLTRGAYSIHRTPGSVLPSSATDTEHFLQNELQRCRQSIDELTQALDVALTCRRRQIGDMIVDTLLHPLSVLRIPGKLFRITKSLIKKPPQHEAAVAAPSAHQAAVGAPRSDSQLPIPRYPDTYEVRTAAVVICIHNALDDVRRCIASVLENRSFPYEIILVNDGSDAPTRSYIDSLAAQECIRIIHHDTARGYTCAANAGIRSTQADYVVLLNSDTIVTAGWVEKMIDAFENNPRIGVLSPLSNAATYQSVPEEREGKDWCINALPQGVNPQMMNMLVEHSSKALLPELRCVNGFCFMMRRKTLRDVGLLDEERFPMGYGEEVDYCLRVNQAGYTCNVLDNTYIYHAKTKSFTPERRKQLVASSAQTLHEKHPRAYSALLQFLNDTDCMAQCRAQVKEALSRQLPWMNKLCELRIGFLLPVQGGSGGANSVCQEAYAWRQLGFNVSIVNAEKYRRVFETQYPQWKEHCQWYKNSPASLAYNFDLMIATAFNSVQPVKEMKDVNPELRVGYYIQDYEPLFFDVDSEHYTEAVKSYTLIPDVIAFAKTDWICDTVQEKHPDVSVRRVQASLNWHHYNPFVIRKTRNTRTVRIAAMIRPSTTRRRPEETMHVFYELKKQLKGRVELHCFGCNELEFNVLPYAQQTEIVNHGLLKPGEAGQILAQCDVFLDMSSYQAFGRTGLEGMALGCVPVLPSQGGVYEYAVHGENALILDTFDEQLVIREIIRLAKNPAEIARMKMNGLKTARRYSVMNAAWSEIQMLSDAYTENK